MPACRRNGVEPSKTVQYNAWAMSVGYFQKYSFYEFKHLLYSKNFFQLYYFEIKPTNLFDIR